MMLFSINLAEVFPVSESGIGLVFYRQPPGNGGRHKDVVLGEAFPEAELSPRPYCSHMSVHQVREDETLGVVGGMTSRTGRARKRHHSTCGILRRYRNGRLVTVSHG